MTVLLAMGKEALSWLAAAILATWVFVTVLNQRDRTRRLIGRLVSSDICGLVPIWTFFAPNPGDTDTHLMFRDRDAEGRVTNWREVRLVGRQNVLDLWNPHRRINKAIVDVVHDLTRREAQHPGPGPQAVSKQRVLSFPYLLILNYVSQQTGDFGAVERQFSIARTPGMGFRDRPDVLLVSSFHKLS